MRLQEAADALGVHYQTAYAWVRAGRLPARKVGRGYQVAEADVRALAADRGRGSEPPGVVRVRDWPAQSARLYQAIVTGQETAARAVAGRLAGRIPVTDLCDRIIAPALRRVGDEWAAGRVSVAREHRATAICERLLAASARPAAGPPRGTAVVATPPGERHGMPALMAAACLRQHRWQVHHLAADLPAAEIAGLAAQVGARLVVLSTATADGARSAAAAADLIRSASPAATVLTGRSGDTLADLLARAG